MARKSRVIRTRRSETTRKRKEDEALESLRKGSKAVASVGATTAVRQAGSTVAKKTGSTAKQKYTNNAVSRTGSQTSFSPSSSSRRTRENTVTRRRSTTAENMEKYMGSGKSGGRRQQTAEVKEKRTKTAERIADLTKGNLKQTAGSHSTTFHSIRDPNEEMYLKAAEIRAKRGEAPFSLGQYGELVNRARTNKEQREKDLKKASKLIDEGTSDIERGKKGLGKAGKFAADVYSAGLGIASDALAGPAATASMVSRSFGNAYKSAKDEGATDSQAALYGAGMGALEAATEKMFAVSKPLQKLYGKGAADDLTERVINKMVSKASTQGGKDLAYHGGKVFASAVTEGLEEMVAEGMDPVIANHIYANALGSPHEMASLQDLLYSGAVGGAMGGVLGGAGQVVDYRKGRSVRNVFGDDGIKKLADAASQVDDEAKAVQAQAMTAMIGSGENLAAGQVKQLADMVAQQDRRDAERSSIARASAESLIRREGYISPSKIDSQTGREMMRERTHSFYEKSKEEAADAIKASFAGELQLPDAKVTELSEAISAIRAGVAEATDVNLFTTANPEARTAYEVVMGEQLPETNGATREYIYRRIAENRLDVAKMETDVFVDEIKGLLQQDIIPTYEASGQEALSAVMKDINVGNAAQVEDTIVTFEDFYNAGRSGISYAQISSYGNPVYESLSSRDRMAAWKAGQKDYFAAQGVAKGTQVRLGEKIALSRSEGHSGARKGRLISELSKENRKNFTASEQMVFRTLARTFNINIHVVDRIEGDANGLYIDGEVYLSMSGDRNLFYVFAHEITHHLEVFAPEEHFKLKELIRRRWTEQGGIEKAISQKIDHYNQFGKTLSREDALDEIIADSTYEMIQDEGFVDELCRTDRNLAQAVLDAIKALISKVREVLTFGDQFKPAQNEMLLSNLDILKEAQKLWVDGLVRAAENRDTVGVMETNATKKHSINSFNITKDIVANNMVEIARMDPVASMTGNEFQKGNQKLSSQVETYFDSMGNTAFNDVLGDVELVRKGISDDIAHGMGRNKAISFTAIPDVVRDGKIIDVQYNWKGRNYDTVVIAAPVAIGNDDYFMAVVIKRDVTVNMQRHYVHEVLLQKNISKPFKSTATQKGSTRGGFADVYSLLQNIVEVKNGSLNRDDLIQRLSTNEGKFSFDVAKAAENRGAVGTVSEMESVARFSLKEFVDGKRFVEVDGDTSIFDGLSEREQGTLATKIIKEKFAGKVIGIDNKVFVNGRGAGEYGFPAKKLGTTEHDAKMRASSELDNIVDAGFNFRNKADGEDGHTHKDVVGGFDYFDVVFKLGSKYFQGVINIKNVKNGKLFKDLTKIKDVTEDISSSYGENPKSTFLRTSSIDSISEDGENSNIKFSFAGESALNADNKVLQKAKEMYDDFESSETIRQETGWHRGGDGKWRFELDDSQMRVHKAGDALFRKENPKYVRFQELYGKFFDGSLTEDEQKEWTDLNKVYGNEYSRLRKRLESGKARLEDILEHDILFDNYPMLGRVKVRLDDLGEGTRGTYNPGANMITLDRKLFGDSYRTEKRNGTLIHEIQHAIQEIEGLSGGASPELYRDNLTEGMTESEMYRYTAGEVEARDAANRQSLDAEQRQSTRPDIDSPVIFAEDYIKYSFKDDTSITYESLVTKPDMKVVQVDEDVSHDKNDIKHAGKENARSKKNKRNTENETYVYVKDVDADIMIPTKALMHGYRHNSDATTAVIYRVGDYLEGAIKINEINPQDKNAIGAYILLGYGESDDGRYPAYFVVNQYDDETAKVVGVEVLDKLYSANAKKMELAANAVGDGDNISLLPSSSISTISISDLLGIVNEMYSDILPKSVAEHYGHGRKVSKLGGNVKYSLPDADSMYEYVAEHTEEFPDEIPVRDYERDAKRVRIQTNRELLAQIEKLKMDKRLTHGKVLDKKSVREEMNSLIRILMSISDGTPKKTDHKLVETAVNNATIIYNALKNEDYATAANTAYDAAVHIVENLQIVDDRAFREYKELRDYLRGTPVTISEQDRQSIPDFGHFRKENMGRLRIVNEGGVAVDTVYAELCDVYPELFDESVTHPADQLIAMAEVRQELEPYDVMLSEEETEQLIKTAAQDLLDISAIGKPWKSWADKKKEVYDEKLARLKSRHKEAMRDVKIKERMRATRMVDVEKARARDKAQRQKLHKEHRKSFGSIEKNAKWLSDRLLKPTDDKHIPEQFKTAVAHLLQQLDLQTERSKKLEEIYGKAKKTIRMEEMRRAYAELAKEDDSGIFEYDGYVFDLIDALGMRMDDRSVDEMSNEDLRAVDILLKSIVANIRNYNKAFSDNIKEEISQLGDAVISEAAARKRKRERDGGIIGGADTILNESMVTPRDFFEQMGSGMEAVFMEMRKGLDQHIDNLTETRAFFEGTFKKYNNRKKPGSKIENWRSDKQIKEITLESGKTIKLTPAQMMSLYCLSKRDQAMGHILGSGIVASRVDTASRLRKALGAKMQSDSTTTMISPGDVQTIIGDLTQEQIELADRLQDFLNNECAEWGNAVSMKMYGYRKFTEENYFPIKSADAYLDSNFEGRETPERIKNFGFTKGTVVNANNPIMIDDIFKVVADHINKMSLYNAFAAPISDFTRVYNYKQRNEAGFLEGSVKSSLEEGYGKKAINYINNFMADVNNSTKTRTEGIGRFVTKSLANYKKATIGANLRVALQQPTAVMRAFISISPKYFVNGNMNIAKNLQDMKEHCQIARWKSWGHNQVDMARDIDDIMMNAEWTRLDVVTMQAYGALDNITWSTIWAAVRKETKAKHPTVTVDSEEFYRICNERASEIFDKTQVVDSVFHKSQVMRRDDLMSKMYTSFMAEPTRTFNMVRSELVSAREMWKNGDKTKAIVKASKATSVFVMNAALCSAAAALADMLRGKDADGDGEEDGWLENFLANFWDNVNPINMIPVVKDIWGFKDGWGTQNMALEGYDALVQSIMGLAEADDMNEAIKKLAESMGLVFGIPVKNALREWETICDLFGINAFAGEIGEEEKEKGFAAKGMNALKSFGGFNIIKDGSNLDKMLGKVGLSRTEAEKESRQYEKDIRSLERSLRNLSGEEYQEKLWDKVTDGYTTLIEDGDVESLKKMRSMLKDLGGDVELFDKRVDPKIISAFKKSMGTIENDTYRLYLLDHGWSETEISHDIVCKTDTAKEYQIAACMNDETAEILAMADLISAGITYEDICELYATRNKAIKGGDYSTGEMINPVEGTITSGFGYRDAPTAGASTYHTAVDIGASEGTAVVAADGGRVSKAGWNGGYGISVTVDHGDGRYTIYNHLSGRAVQVGDAVAQGQELGKVGSTGISTGPHLDFQVRINGEYVDPMNYIGEYYN